VELKSLLRHSVILLLVLGALMTLVSAAVSFIRNLVFELGFVFLLPVLLGPDGIWLAVDAADLCCLLLSVTLILAYRKRYGY